MKTLLLLGAIACANSTVLADPPLVVIDSPSQFVCKILRDPKTKVIFYLESDRHHLSAISPEGKLLWQFDTWSKLYPDFKSETLAQQKNGALIIFIDLYRGNFPMSFTNEGWTAQHLGDRDDYLAVAFNKGELGLIRRSTGEYTFLIQN